MQKHYRDVLRSTHSHPQIHSPSIPLLFFWGHCEKMNPPSTISTFHVCMRDHVPLCIFRVCLYSFHFGWTSPCIFVHVQYVYSVVHSFMLFISSLPLWYGYLISVPTIFLVQFFFFPMIRRKWREKQTAFYTFFPWNVFSSDSLELYMPNLFNILCVHTLFILWAFFSSHSAHFALHLSRDFHSWCLQAEFTLWI